MKRKRGLLFQSNINQLRKVSERLNYKQRMDATQIILSAENQEAVVTANDLIYKAIKILEGIQ